ncbi:unnamed protein product [Rotaria sp. Silwood2]|nr:unnamed protein product [Rotaria sp. Silwood2]
MASSSSSQNENSCEKDTRSAISVIRHSTRTRPISREDKLLHRTRSGGVDHSSSPQNTNRKINSSQDHHSKISSVNIESSMNTSDDTDEDVNDLGNTSVSINPSGVLTHIG